MVKLKHDPHVQTDSIQLQLMRLESWYKGQINQIQTDLQKKIQALMQDAEREIQHHRSAEINDYPVSLKQMARIKQNYSDRMDLKRMIAYLRQKGIEPYQEGRTWYIKAGEVKHIPPKGFRV